MPIRVDRDGYPVLRDDLAHDLKISLKTLVFRHVRPGDLTCGAIDAAAQREFCFAAEPFRGQYFTYRRVAAGNSLVFSQQFAEGVTLS